MSRKLQNARDKIKSIKQNLADMQNVVLDFANDDPTKAIILEKTIRAWRTLKELVGEK